MRHARVSSSSLASSVLLTSSLLLFALLLLLSGCGSPSASSSTATPASSSEPITLGMAVEFTDHAAATFVALEKGWFKEAGITINSFESYATGVELAAALARGDIQVANLCLVPAVTVRANGEVPVKVVAGTHLYGYALVVNPAKVQSVSDLGKADVKIGCVEPGGATDVLLQRLCRDARLSTTDIAPRVQRMNPPSQVLALQAGAIDACFVPEHWATVAENLGFSVLVTAQEIWPDLLGSVVVVKQELIDDHPDVVKKLVSVTNKADKWINEHPDEAAVIVASRLSASGETPLAGKGAEAAAKLEITPELIRRSMSRLVYTTAVDPEQVQAIIDYMDELGYLKSKITTEDLLDLRFLSQ